MHNINHLRIPRNRKKATHKDTRELNSLEREKIGEVGAYSNRTSSLRCKLVYMVWMGCPDDNRDGGGSMRMSDGGYG